MNLKTTLVMKTEQHPWSRFLLSDRYVDFGLLALRLFVGGLMLTHGIAKLQHFGALREGFPDPIGWGSGLSFVMIILVEVGCSLMVMAGLLTRFAVVPMIFAMCMAMTTLPDTSLSGIELPLFYVGTSLVLFITGPGRYSIDRLIRKYFSRPEA